MIQDIVDIVEEVIAETGGGIVEIGEVIVEIGEMKGREVQTEDIMIRENQDEVSAMTEEGKMEGVQDINDQRVELDTMNNQDLIKVK
jgi:hypothetical protein